MENLIFSLNATAPVFLMMLLGMLFRRLGWIDEAFASRMNRFVFLVPLPVLVFHDLASAEIGDVWNFRFVAFCFLVTAASIAICALLSCLLKEKTQRGEFIQASYRSSAALLGIALTTNIYGDAGLVPLMIIGSVPLYNVMAVVVLSLTAPDEKGLRAALRLRRRKSRQPSAVTAGNPFPAERRFPETDLWKRTLKGIVTNPIILGILAGLLWSILRLPLPPILEKTVTSLGDLAAPLGLMAMGATFRLDKAVGQAKPAIAASFIKLVGFCILFLPLAVRLGFREEELVAILIMLGSATTVSCYVMAKSMGHEGVLTSSAVMLTTLFSAFTITGLALPAKKLWAWCDGVSARCSSKRASSRPELSASAAALRLLSGEDLLDQAGGLAFGQLLSHPRSPSAFSARPAGTESRSASAWQAHPPRRSPRMFPALRKETESGAGRKSCG